MDKNRIIEMLKIKKQYLYHREGQELEFKEQYNFKGLAGYFRDFAGLAAYTGVSGRQFRRHPDIKPEHTDILSIQFLQNIINQ